MRGNVVSQTMRVVEISRPGTPDVLVPAERPIPVAGTGEVLVRVAAAGVNRPDVLQRRGMYPPPPGASDLPGLEVSGTIAALGPDVHGWREGDQVCALISGGGYAEYCVIPAPQCLPLPRGVDLIHAGGIPETTFTVWTNVFDRGRLASGETLLVHGGSSGIGTTAIQLAHARRARVFATAGSADKCAACEALGAEQAINYHETDFVAAVREATAGRGVDVVLDMVAGEYVQRNLEALAIDGRLVVIGRQGGMKSEIDVMPILRKRLTLTGSTLRTRSVAEKGAIAEAVRHHVWPLFESGDVRVVLHQTFPLEQAAEAHRVMEAGTHIGKLVLLTQA
jgi:NADPH2:quinone reductase